MANDDEITKVLAMLNAAYPRFKLTEETIKVYIRLLGDLSAEDLQIAAVQCASNRDFFPSVHELRRAVVELRRKSGNIPSAYEAWIEVSSNRKEEITQAEEKEDGSVEVWKEKYVFSHPIVEKVAREMGWPGRFPGENEVADRSHFIKAYELAMNDVMDYELMLPEVREFIDSQRHRELGAGDYGVVEDE
jgi:hypothetical protein